MENRFCDTCSKEDVCMFKDTSSKAAKDIKEITGRADMFLKSNLVCEKWSGKIVNPRKAFGGD